MLWFFIVLHKRKSMKHQPEFKDLDQNYLDPQHCLYHNYCCVQGNTIQSQLQGLREREMAIDTFEHKMHLLRIKVQH